MKTLGQIAREAFDATPVDYTKTFDKQDAMWEAAAQAVRAAVLDEAAAFIEKQAMVGTPRGLLERGAMLLCATWCRQDIKDMK